MGFRSKTSSAGLLCGRKRRPCRRNPSAVYHGHNLRSDTVHVETGGTQHQFNDEIGTVLAARTLPHFRGNILLNSQRTHGFDTGGTPCGYESGNRGSQQKQSCRKRYD